MHYYVLDYVGFFRVAGRISDNTLFCNSAHFKMKSDSYPSVLICTKSSTLSRTHADGEGYFLKSKKLFSLPIFLSKVFSFLMLLFLINFSL